MPQQATAADALIGHWKFDEGTGVVAADSSGNGYHGALTNGATWNDNDLPCDFASALAVDGVNDYVSIPGAVVNQRATGTLSMWAKWTGNQDPGYSNWTYGAVTGRQKNNAWNEFTLGLTGQSPSTATIEFSLVGADLAEVTGSTAIGDDVWRHVAVTYTPGAFKLYVDGVQDGTSTASITLNNDASIPLTIGGWIGDGGSYAKAQIADVRIYDYVLSPAEIEELTCTDTAPPVLDEVTPVPSPDNDATPTYTFSSTEAGDISYGGSCTSNTAVAVSGNSVITFSTLADGTYSDCTITVTDAAGNVSDPLAVSAFTIDTAPPLILAPPKLPASVAPSISGGGGQGGRRHSPEKMRSLINAASILLRDRSNNNTREIERSNLEEEGVTSPSATPTPAKIPPTIAVHRGRLLLIVHDTPVLYTDVESDSWYAPFVADLIMQGIAEGYRDRRGNLIGEFGVSKPVTYAEVLKMAYELSGTSIAEAEPHNSSARNTWAARYVHQGEKDRLPVLTTTLDVHAPARRGEAIALLLAAIAIPLDPTVSHSYTDLPTRHPYAEAILTASSYGLINGDFREDATIAVTVRPDDLVNRAEMSKIVALLRGLVIR